MKMLTRNPLQSLVQIRCLQSSGRALNVFLGRICPKCSKKADGTSSERQTTSCTCLQRLFAPSSNDSADVSNTDGANTEVPDSLTEGNGFTPSSLSDDTDKSVAATDHPSKSSVHKRLKIWINSGHNGIMGRYGNKVNCGVPKKSSIEHVDPGWPDWLVNAAPEAVHGWLPQQLDSFEKLGKVCY
jgi:cyclin-dependent kinase 12/13